MRAALRMCGLALSIVIGAEVGARLDDWIFDQIPIAANPASEDLITRDELGRHGKPYAHFKKWHLDNFGFRGPDIQLKPQPSMRRILILGASETFGLYESADAEFPALLRKDNLGHLEIVNTAVVGMGLASMVSYWERLLITLDPNEVLIYPTPLFYLADEPAAKPRNPAATTPDALPARGFHSRFLDRLRSFLHKPDFLQILLDQRVIEAQLVGKPPGWMFKEVPTDRLEAYRRDLNRLVVDIQAHGTSVILMTHAIRFRGDEADIDNEFAVWEMRVYTPRASGRILVDFNAAANEQLRALAQARGARVVDISAAVSGCRACFGDLVHFTDLGARKVAATIQRALNPTPPAQPVKNAVQ